MSHTSRSLFQALTLACAAICANAQTATLRPDGNRPEDPALRAEAVRLLERANHVSTPATWPPSEMTLRFRVGAPALGDAYDGEYVSSVGGPGLRRQHWKYGAYDFTQIRNGQRVNRIASNVPRPAVLSLLSELAPIYLVRFDHEDVIRSISDPTPGSRCIAFDTITGQRVQANEVCVDPVKGWLLSIRIGDTITRNSEFFAFQDAYLPGHVERWAAGRKVIEIETNLVVKSEYAVDFFEVGADASAYVCQQFRRAYEISTPQPPAGASILITDIRLQGIIDDKGRVVNLKALDTAHPELNEEAIKLVSTWTFQPATCDGNTVMWGTTFTVHFVGR